MKMEVLRMSTWKEATMPSSLGDNISVFDTVPCRAADAEVRRERIISVTSEDNSTAVKGEFITGNPMPYRLNSSLGFHCQNMVQLDSYRTAVGQSSLLEVGNIAVKSRELTTYDGSPECVINLLKYAIARTHTRIHTQT